MRCIHTLREDEMFLVGRGKIGKRSHPGLADNELLNCLHKQEETIRAVLEAQEAIVLVERACSVVLRIDDYANGANLSA